MLMDCAALATVWDCQYALPMGGVLADGQTTRRWLGDQGPHEGEVVDLVVAHWRYYLEKVVSVRASWVVFFWLRPDLPSRTLADGRRICVRISGNAYFGDECWYWVAHAQASTPALHTG